MSKIVPVKLVKNEWVYGGTKEIVAIKNDLISILNILDKSEFEIQLKIIEENIYKAQYGVTSNPEYRRKYLVKLKITLWNGMK